MFPTFFTLMLQGTPKKTTSHSYPCCLMKLSMESSLNPLSSFQRGPQVIRSPKKPWLLASAPMILTSACLIGNPSEEPEFALSLAAPENCPEKGMKTKCSFHIRFSCGTAPTNSQSRGRVPPATWGPKAGTHPAPWLLTRRSVLCM